VDARLGLDNPRDEPAVFGHPKRIIIIIIIITNTIIIIIAQWLKGRVPVHVAECVPRGVPERIEIRDPGAQLKGQQRSRVAASQ
jgi:hypothetical protein